MKLETLQIINKDAFRQKLTQYTSMAFYMIPPINNPNILDIGCGTGVPTIKLAKISGGHITAIDNDKDQLNCFNQKIKNMGLGKKIETVNCSLLDIDFPDESFDIIWAEGSIFAIGFEKCLQDWKHLIKNQGFLVIHDPYKEHQIKLKTIKKSGYRLLDYFLINYMIWWLKFYKPYQNHLKNLHETYKDNSDIQQALKKEEKEIHMFKEDPKSCNSIFYVMQKI